MLKFEFIFLFLLFHLDSHPFLIEIVIKIKELLRIADREMRNLIMFISYFSIDHQIVLHVVTYITICIFFCLFYDEISGYNNLVFISKFFYINYVDSKLEAVGILFSHFNVVLCLIVSQSVKHVNNLSRVILDLRK